ncbi:MAG TPA: TIGR00266 family protein [Acidimicrobiales bacterium]|nr:TIGR00266 family protein [Acidimicrobiales bacterium]
MTVQSHEVDYEIFGDDLQFVSVELDPGETVIGEAGTMMFIEDGVTFESKMGDGAEPEQGFFGKLKSAGKRALTGESVFLTHFTNNGSGKAHAAFAAPYPGKIVPVDLAALGGRLIAQKDAFLCAALGTKIGIAFQRKLGTGLMGGEGFILQDLQGDGMVFLHAGGTIVEKQLRNETLRIDTGCIVAFEPTIEYSIEKAGNLKSMIFGGEGLFLATLSGSGRVWVQSLPFDRLASRVLANQVGLKSDDQGSVIGGLSNIFERD